MRIYVLYLLVVALAVYAWRNWFVSLCGLILLAVVLERKDMPTNIMEIQGLNPWNMLMLAIAVAWLTTRRHEGLVWDFPRGPALLLVAYLTVLLVAYGRAAADVDSFPREYRPGFLSMAADEIINPLKYMIAGLMLYDGCRTRRRLLMGLACVLVVSLGYALLVIKCMPVTTLFGEGNLMAYRRRINRETGLNACDMAMVLSGGFWAAIASLALWRQWVWRLAAGAAAGIIGLGLAVCQTRAGYLAVAVLAVVMGLLRWRWILVALPVVILIVFGLMPSIPARLVTGFDAVDAAGQDSQDWAQISSGRLTSIWPPVLEQIAASPLVGFGRRAILRTPAYQRILEKDGVVPTHPHNAYLEMEFDAGLIGLLVAAALYAGLVLMAAQLFRDRQDPLVSAVGGAAISSVGALLVSGLSAQSLFPTVSMMSMWCFCGLLLRVWRMRQQQCVTQLRNGLLTRTAMPRVHCESRSP